MRPKQWVKNFFILMPLVFSENLFDFPVVSKAMIAFGLFCLSFPKTPSAPNS